MNINEEKIEDKVKNIPPENRVFIYNAEIILDFLRQTFIPTHFFLKSDPKIGLGGKVLTKNDFKDEMVFESFNLELETLYEYYLLFRQQKDYTSPVETKFRFCLIISKLRYFRNGWEFLIKRYTRNQIRVAYPLQLRVRANQDIRDKYPVNYTTKNNVESEQVDVEMEDINQVQKDETIQAILDDETPLDEY